jgi:hypothetical protein
VPSIPSRRDLIPEGCKRCTLCQKVKPAEISFSGGNHGRRQTQCKACRRVKDHEYRQLPHARELAKLRKRRYMLGHVEQAQRQKQRWREKNRIKIKLYDGTPERRARNQEHQRNWRLRLKMAAEQAKGAAP